MANARALAVLSGLVVCYMVASQLQLLLDYTGMQHNYYHDVMLAPGSQADPHAVGPTPPHYNQTLIKQSNNIPVKFFGAGKPGRDRVNPAWAYYDPRYGRVTVITLSWATLGDAVYCRYFASNGTELTPAVKSTVDPDYLVHCQRGRYAPLISLSYQAKEPIDIGQTINVTVLPSELPDNSSFSVCLSPIFGDYHHWLLLLQFIEFHRLVGADHFFIYVLEVKDAATQRLLDFYSLELRVATVIHIPRSDQPNRTCAGIHRCRHNAQIQDCVYRSVHRFALTAVIDIDEFMAPAEAGTLQQLVSSFPTPERFGAYKFRNRWVFRPEEDPKADVLQRPQLDVTEFVRSNLPALRFHRSTGIAPPGHTSKCLVRPERVAHMGVHYVRQFISPAYRTYGVPASDGLMRHYRNTSAASWAPHFMQEVYNFGPVTNTSLPDTLATALARRCVCVLSQLRGKLQQHFC